MNKNIFTFLNLFVMKHATKEKGEGEHSCRSLKKKRGVINTANF